MADLGSVASYNDMTIFKRSAGLVYQDQSIYQSNSYCYVLSNINTTKQINGLIHWDTSTFPSNSSMLVYSDISSYQAVPILMWFNQGTQTNKLNTSPDELLMIELQPSSYSDSSAADVFVPKYMDHTTRLCEFLSNPYMEGGDATIIYRDVDHTILVDVTREVAVYYDYSYSYQDFTTDFAYNKNCTANNYYYNGIGYPSDAVDADVTGTWQSGGQSSSPACWWQVDLGEIKHIHRIIGWITPPIGTTIRGSNTVINYRSTYSLKYSSNGVDYTNLLDETRMIPHWDETYDFDITARYIQMYNISMPDNQESQPNIYGFKVFCWNEFYHEPTIIIGGGGVYPVIGGKHIIQVNGIT